MNLFDGEEEGRRKREGRKGKGKGGGKEKC